MTKTMRRVIYAMGAIILMLSSIRVAREYVLEITMQGRTPSFADFLHEAFKPSMERRHIILGWEDRGDLTDFYIPYRYLTYFGQDIDNRDFVVMALSRRAMIALDGKDISGDPPNLAEISDDDDEVEIHLSAIAEGYSGNSFELLQNSDDLKEMIHDYLGFSMWEPASPNFIHDFNLIYFKSNVDYGDRFIYMTKALGLDPRYPCTIYSKVVRKLAMELSFPFGDIAEWPILDRVARRLVVKFSGIDAEAEK